MEKMNLEKTLYVAMFAKDEETRTEFGMRIVRAYGAERGDIFKSITKLVDLATNENLPERVRNSAGESYVRRCVEEGLCYWLVGMDKNERLTSYVRKLVADNIEAAVANAIKRERVAGRWDSLLEIANSELPNNGREEAGKAAIQLLIKDGRYDIIFRISKRQPPYDRIPEHVQRCAELNIEAAGMIAVQKCNDIVKLQEMVIDTMLPDKVREAAGGKVVDGCVFCNDYKLLRKIAENDRLPTKTREQARKELTNYADTLARNPLSGDGLAVEPTTKFRSILYAVRTFGEKLKKRTG